MRLLAAAVALLPAAFAAAETAHAEPALDASKAAPLLLRALGYDRALVARAGDAVNIGVLWRETDDSSAADAAQMIAQLQRLGEVRIQGLPIRAVPLPVKTADQAPGRVAPSVSVLYVARAFSAAELQVIAAAAAQGKSSPCIAPRALKPPWRSACFSKAHNCG